MIDPRLWIAGAALLAAFGAGWGVNGWRLNAQHDREAVERSQAELRQVEAQREADRRVAVAQRQKDNTYEAQIRRINGRLVAAVSVPDRAERLPEPARPACAGATGAELSRRDRDFLVGLAARADTLRAALARCQAGAEEPLGQVAPAQ